MNPIYTHSPIDIVRLTDWQHLNRFHRSRYEPELRCMMVSRTPSMPLCPTLISQSVLLTD
jgi:hypothetical protein